MILYLNNAAAIAGGSISGGRQENGGKETGS